MTWNMKRKIILMMNIFETKTYLNDVGFETSVKTIERFNIYIFFTILSQKHYNFN